MRNKNPFANPDVISLAELQKRIMANGVLDYPRKREMSSAINTVGAWFGLPLDMIPASATFLRDMASFAPQMPTIVKYYILLS